MASGNCSRGEVVLPPPAPVPMATQETQKSLKVTPGELADLVPRLAEYLPAGPVSWRAVVDAAALLSGDLGVSRHLWGEACVSMGRERAALAIAIVASKGAGHFSRSAGGYFAGMVKKDGRGELHLDRSLWALREAKWGKEWNKAGRRSRN
jgi:replication initiation protein RepC